MSADRRRGFESWARSHGDPAVRAHDRRGIAEDLFDAAGADAVSSEHIEEVSKRYRERLAGAQKILLARQVGEEILRWQREPQRSAPPRNPDSRREDDEIIGIELDSMSLSLADVARAVAEKKAAEEETAGRGAREAGRSEPPASGTLGPRGGAQARIASPAQWVAGGPRSGSPSTPASAPDSSPPPSERARSEGAIDWAAPPRSHASSAPRADDDEAGLWAPLRGGSNRAPAADAPDLPPLGLPPLGPPPLSAPPLGPPQARVGGSISVAPAAGPLPSSPPGFGGDLPSSRPPSHPPSRRPRAPDATSTTFEIEGDAIRATPASSPSRSAAPVVPATPWPGAAPSGFAVPRTSVKGGALGRKRTILIGSAVAAILAIAVLVRTSIALSSRPAEVSGHVASEHLGLSMQFAEPWTHERKRDDDSSKLGFRRATSTYYQGVTPEDFLMQLTIVSLTPEDHPANEEDVRRIGTTELVQNATDRSCAPLERDAAAFRCIAKTTYKARTFAVLEEYFLAGSRIVYARAMVEAMADVPPPPPKSGEVVAPPNQRAKPPLIAAVDEAKVQAILDSIQAR